MEELIMSGMKKPVVVFTGQVGLDKRDWLDRVAAEVGARLGYKIPVFHVGKEMYKEDRSIPPGKILQLPAGHLRALRRSVMKDAIRIKEREGALFLNSHATFRWQRALMRGLDADQLESLAPTMCVSVIDDTFKIYKRLKGQHDVGLTVRDVLEWRQNEIVATDAIADGLGVPLYLVARGDKPDIFAGTVELLSNSARPKAYISFPMTHAFSNKRIMAESMQFETTLRRAMLCFSPGDVEGEWKALQDALRAMQRKKNSQGQVMMKPYGFSISRHELAGLEQVMDAQICDRDFHLIDQSDMIVSFVPVLDSGSPCLSSGVERELHHAYLTGKEVYVVWKPKGRPSPFITNHATAVVGSLPELLKLLTKKGRIV